MISFFDWEPNQLNMKRNKTKKTMSSGVGHDDLLFLVPEVEDWCLA